MVLNQLWCAVIGVASVIIVGRGPLPAVTGHAQLGKRKSEQSTFPFQPGDKAVIIASKQCVLRMSVYCIDSVCIKKLQQKGAKRVHVCVCVGGGRDLPHTTKRSQ